MARGARGSVLPRPTNDLMARDDLDLDDGLSYKDLLRQAGAYRDPTKGVVHTMPFGVPYKVGNAWKQQTKVFQVAMSAEEARAKTREGKAGRWDWYCAGVECKLCREPIVGWCLGGRKFAVEHEHVTGFDPTRFGETDAEPPADADEYADASAPVMVEA